MRNTSILILCIFLLCCNYKQHFAKAGTRSIQLIHKWDLVKAEDKKLVTIGDTFTITYSGNWVVYCIPYVNDKTKVSLNADGDVTREEWLGSEKKQRWLIYQECKKYGVAFDSITSKTGYSFNVDSFLKVQAFANVDFSPEKNDSLISSTRANDSLVIEKYIPKIKADDSYCDTMYLYLSKDLNDIDYSLSHKMDSVRHLKAAKIRLIYNAAGDVQRRELLFEIRNIQLEKPVIDRLSELISDHFDRM